jgi:hypothetical protein
MPNWIRQLLYTAATIYLVFAWLNNWEPDPTLWTHYPAKYMAIIGAAAILTFGLLDRTRQ